MPTSRKKKKKEEESKQTIGITAFLMEEEESKTTTKSESVTVSKAAETETTVSTATTKKASTTSQVAKPVEDVESVAEKIVELLKKRGGLVSKDDLVAWAKLRGIKLSTLMKAIEQLAQKKIIVRRIVDDKLCYELKAEQ